MKPNNRSSHTFGVIGLSAALLLPLLLPQQAQALPEDKEQPIKVSADSAELDDRSGTAIYSGTVKLVQGSLELEADQLTLFTNAQGDISRIVATGKPAHFQQQHQAGAPLTHGYGLTLEYDIADDLLTLTNQAKLLRASDSFTGQQIKVNTAKNVVRAFSDKNKPSSRVEMVIQPRSKSQSSESKSSKSQPGNASSADNTNTGSSDQ